MMIYDLNHYDASQAQVCYFKDKLIHSSSFFAQKRNEGRERKIERKEYRAPKTLAPPDLDIFFIFLSLFLFDQTRTQESFFPSQQVMESNPRSEHPGSSLQVSIPIPSVHPLFHIFPFFILSFFSFFNIGLISAGFQGSKNVLKIFTA